MGGCLLKRRKIEKSRFEGCDGFVSSIGLDGEDCGGLDTDCGSGTGVEEQFGRSGVFLTGKVFFSGSHGEVMGMSFIADIWNKESVHRKRVCDYFV